MGAREGIERRAAGSVAWAVLEGGGLILISVGTLLLLARILGPMDFGIVAVALVIVQVLTILVEDTFNDAVVQRRDLGPAHVDTAFWTATLVGGALSLACWAASGAYGAMMGRPDLGHVLGWMGLALVANGAGTVPLALLRRDLGYRAIAIRSLTGKVLGAAIAICMVLLGFGLWSLVAQHLVATAASALWLLATMAERPRLRLSRARLAELLRVGAPVCATALMAAGLFRVYTVALGVLFGPVPAGLFNMASRLVDTTSGLVNKTAFQISLALLSARQHDPLAVRHALGRATEASCFLALPVYAGLAACAGDLVPALLGPAWAPAIPLIQILALSAMASTALLLYTAAYNAMGRPELGAFGLAAEWAGAFGALALLGQGEVTGAALAWLCRHLLLVPVSVLVMRRALGSGLVEQLGGAARAMVACAAMAGCIHLVREHALAGWSPLETLLVTVPTGVLAYAAASLLVQRRTAAAILGELTGRPRHSPAGAD